MKNLDNFLLNSSVSTLEKHFITEEMIDLYRQGLIDEFLLAREEQMKLMENIFVDQFDIKYTGFYET